MGWMPRSPPWPGKPWSRNLAGRAQDMSIQLAQAVSLPPLSADGADIHLEAEVRSPLMPPCRVAVEVGIYVRGARRNSVFVYLDVKKLQPVPVAVRRIDSGEAFSADNVRLERLAVENTQRAAVAAAGLMGRRARRPVSAGRPIEPDDVEDGHARRHRHPSQRSGASDRHRSAICKSRRAAKPCRAAESAKLIQVRNLDSKTTVTGRVVDGSTVEVEY